MPTPQFGVVGKNMTDLIGFDHGLSRGAAGCAAEPANHEFWFGRAAVHAGAATKQSPAAVHK